MVLQDVHKHAEMDNKPSVLPLAHLAISIGLFLLSTRFSYSFKQFEKHHQQIIVQTINMRYIAFTQKSLAHSVLGEKQRSSGFQPQQRIGSVHPLAQDCPRPNLPPLDRYCCCCSSALQNFLAGKISVMIFLSIFSW